LKNKKTAHYSELDGLLTALFFGAIARCFIGLPVLEFLAFSFVPVGHWPKIATNSAVHLGLLVTLCHLLFLPVTVLIFRFTISIVLRNLLLPHAADETALTTSWSYTKTTAVFLNYSAKT